MKALALLMLLFTGTAMAGTTEKSLSVVRAGCNASGSIYYFQGHVQSDGGDVYGGNVAACYFRGTDLVLKGIQGSALIEDMCQYAYQNNKEDDCKAAAYKELNGR